MPIYNQHQVGIVGEVPTSLVFNYDQVVMININNIDAIKEAWVKESAHTCCFQTGNSSSVSGPLWNSDTKEWQYHLTCIDGVYKGWQTYLEEKFLLTNETTRRIEDTLVNKKKSDNFGTILKIILFIIFLFLLASYMFKDNSKAITYDSCMKYAKNAQQRYYCDQIGNGREYTDPYR